MISSLLRFNNKLYRSKIFYNCTSKKTTDQYKSLITMRHQQLNMHLTEQQKKIFDTFLKYREQLKLKTVFRVAGGWVRDKILQKESEDIDITLDDMKGEQFVNMLIEHAKQKGQQIHGFGVTKFNPEMSKHLETATLRLFNHSIDLVNLRSEKYSQDSRIPIIDIGTPKQDAQRRDLTINSLFYNLITMQVQDWTGKGITDLKNGIIRTPLQPYITFLDDPLRVLRCFRFAGRFGYKIMPEIEQAIKNKEVRNALQNKVSKQRIGTQLSGMLKVDRVLQCLMYIKRNHLWNLVFQISKQADLAQQSTQLIESIPDYCYNCLEMFLQSLQKNNFITKQKLIISKTKDQQQKMQTKIEHGHMINEKLEQSLAHEQQKSKCNKKQQKSSKKKQKGQKGQKGQKKKKQAVRYEQQQLKILSRLACILVFYRSYKKITPKRSECLIEHIVINQLKYPAKHLKFVSKIADSINAYEKIGDLDQVNKIIKWLRISQQKWEIALHMMQGIELLEKRKPIFHPMQMRKYVLEQQLSQSYLLDAHIDGTFLTSKGKKGPIIGTILDNAVTWRILNPKSTKQQFLQIYDKNPQFFENQNAYC